MEQLGIQPILLLAQIVNFAIVVFVLQKLLYKPVLTMLHKRQEEIDNGLKTAEKMKKEEERLNEKGEKLLDDARKEAKKILEEAKTKGKEKEKEIVAQAHEEAKQVLAKAKQEAKEAARAFEKDARRQAVTIAQEMVLRVLPESLTDADHRKIFQKNLKDVEGAVKAAN